MSNFSILTQIGMIIAAVTITLTFIKPTYANIQARREMTKMYVTEADKVKEVDDMLIRKAAIIDSVSAADTAALKRYVPDSVDDVAVMKDIQAIFIGLALPLVSLTVGGAGSVVTSGDGAVDSGLIRHSYAVSTKLSYSELKTLLKVIEVNNYLLQVDSLSIAPGETGDLGVALSLSTFSRSTSTAAVIESDENLVE